MEWWTIDKSRGWYYDWTQGNIGWWLGYKTVFHTPPPCTLRWSYSTLISRSNNLCRYVSMQIWFHTYVYIYMQKTNQLHEPHYQRIHLPTGRKTCAIFRMKRRSSYCAVESFGARSIIYKHRSYLSTYLVYSREWTLNWKCYRLRFSFMMLFKPFASAILHLKILQLSVKKETSAFFRSEQRCFEEVEDVQHIGSCLFHTYIIYHDYHHYYQIII